MDPSIHRAQTRNGVFVNNDGANLHITMPGQAVGWRAVEDAIRTDDERQAQSCKEDIDSLLTFAGLYSAALTALLALSFSMLQEDTAGESLQVLRQIAQQTANYQLLPNGSLTATFTTVISPSLTPFEPSPGALRVNILWFASLVFSLSTASIGILVKQWLRAYLSYQTSSAQGRMRVRHFRRQGIEVWKVYEIAAVLPFLIQLALGLFFVGLCYFTASVHRDLGRATLPLVTGWALFIFVVTILPVASSHCPYKPALFENLFSVIRPRLFSLMATIFVLIDRLTRTTCSLASTIFASFARHMRRLRARLSESLRRFSATDSVLSSFETNMRGVSINRFLWGLLALIAKPFSAIAERLWGPNASVTHTLTNFIDELRQSLLPGGPAESALKRGLFGRLALWARNRTRNCGDIARPYDETDAVKFSGKDISILVSADSLQSDDDLLATAIVDALKQSQPTLEQAATLLVGALQSRVLYMSDGRRLRWEDDAAPLDCRSLTLRATAALMDVIGLIPDDEIHHACSIAWNRVYFNERDRSAARGLSWILHILFSPSQYPLSLGCLRFLGTCLHSYHGANSELLNHIRMAFVDQPEQTLRLLLSATRQYCISRGFSPDSTGTMSLGEATAYIADVLRPYLQDAWLPDLRSLRAVFNDNLGECSNWATVLNKTSLEETIQWLTESLEQELDRCGTKWPPGYHVDFTVSCIFHLSFIVALSQPRRLRRSYDTSPFTDRIMLRIFTSTKHLPLAIQCYTAEPSTFLLNRQIPQKFTDSLNDETLEQLDQVVVSILYDPLSKTPSVIARLSYAITHTARASAGKKTSTLTEGDRRHALTLHLWRRIFRRITVALQDLSENVSSESIEDIKCLVERSLIMIDEMDVADKYRYAALPPNVLRGGKNREKEKDWRIQFDSGQSLVSNRFIFFLANLLPDHSARPAIDSWRLRLLDAMSGEDKRVALKDDEHDDSSEPTTCEDIDVPSLPTENPEQEGEGWQLNPQQIDENLETVQTYSTDRGGQKGSAALHVIPEDKSEQEAAMNDDDRLENLTMA